MSSDKKFEIRIEPSLIVSVVKKTVLEIDGVAKLAGNQIVSALAEIVGSRRLLDRAVQVSMTDAGVSIEIFITLWYGSNIRSVASKVQKAVKSEVEKITGFNVLSVSVAVRDVEDKPEENDDKTEAENGKDN